MQSTSWVMQPNFFDHLVPLRHPELAKKKDSTQIKDMKTYQELFSETNTHLGCGGFGRVIAITNKKGKTYAAKRIRIASQKSAMQAKREFSLLNVLRHPNIVRMHGAFGDSENHIFVIIMERFSGHDLLQMINSVPSFCEQDVIIYVKQILDALQYIHRLKVIHLDVKPENIMCVSKNSKKIKLIDFGLARELTADCIGTDLYGTKEYISPEILNYNRITTACDMWSLGVVVYVLISGTLPFKGDSWNQVALSIRLANYNFDDHTFRCVSDRALDFIRKVFVCSPENRLTAEAALEHPWIKERSSKSLQNHLQKAKRNIDAYFNGISSGWGVV